MGNGRKVALDLRTRRRRAVDFAKSTDYRNLGTVIYLFDSRLYARLWVGDMLSTLGRLGVSHCWKISLFYGRD
jgi:hypothetical protein